MILIRAWSGLVLLVGFVLLCQVASLAQAMCVYNQTDIEIAVEFNCGLFCESDWTLNRGAHKCRTEAGAVETNWVYGGGGYSPDLEVDVDRHGYVVMTRVDSDTIQVCSYREDNSLRDCQTFNPKHALPE